VKLKFNSVKLKRISANISSDILMKRFIIAMIALVAATNLSASLTASEESVPFSHEQQALMKFSDLKKSNSELPSFEVFSLALQGFNNLKSEPGQVKKDILTVMDFSLSSNEKRMWVIDLKNNKVLFNDLVAHGRNSGNEFAKKFSNVPETNMSSIGFYVSGETYFGKHGLSMLLHGKDAGYNDNARKRAIVMHGADYVSESFIKKYGRLGRSFGCPAVSMTIYKDLIKTIADGSVIFIYYPDNEFLKNSKVLLKKIAA
jgi:hypothetical protein